MFLLCIIINVSGIIYLLFVLKEVKDDKKDHDGLDNPAFEKGKRDAIDGHNSSGRQTFEIDEAEKPRSCLVDFFNPIVAVECFQLIARKRMFSARNIVIFIIFLYFVCIAPIYGRWTSSSTRSSLAARDNEPVRSILITSFCNFQGSRHSNTILCGSNWIGEVSCTPQWPPSVPLQLWLEQLCWSAVRRKSLDWPMHGLVSSVRCAQRFRGWFAWVSNCDWIPICVNEWSILRPMQPTRLWCTQVKSLICLPELEC